MQNFIFGVLKYIGIGTSLFSLSLLPTVWASPVGGESSGGADHYQIVRAWFLSEDPHAKIQACYEMHPDFGVENEAVERMIHTSFKTWRDYLNQKKLNFGPTQLRIASKINLKSTCTGNEDLKFYLGVENTEVKKGKLKYFRPFGFSELQSDTPPVQPLWGKGYVWIASHMKNEWGSDIPIWPSKLESLSALLLHEVGHIFGNGHVDGTVMTGKIGQYLENDVSQLHPTPSVLSKYQQIDSEVELVPCLTCYAKYNANSVFDLTTPEPKTSEVSADWISSFRVLTGKEPAPPLSIYYERTGIIEGDGQLTYIDQSGTYLFPIQLNTLIAERSDNTPVFQGHCGTQYFSFGASYLGIIRTLTGAEIQVAVNYNMDRRKVSILPLGEQFFPSPLFVSEGAY